MRSTIGPTVHVQHFV